MSVLKLIPMDGTHDQLHPFFKLRGKDKYYCYDLQAAEDRVPLLLLFEVFQFCFDRSFASACVNTTLATHSFLPLREHKTKNSKPLDYFDPKLKMISFITGQPLGLMASWALFALSHHIIVWTAAESVYPAFH